jgi:hypothetical protein
MALMLRLKFHGPNTLKIGVAIEPIPVGQSVSFETEVLSERTSLAESKQFWEMERTFNELTKGRLHVELFER